MHTFLAFTALLPAHAVKAEQLNKTSGEKCISDWCNTRESGYAEELDILVVTKKHEFKTCTVQRGIFRYYDTSLIELDVRPVGVLDDVLRLNTDSYRILDSTPQHFVILPDDIIVFDRGRRLSRTRGVEQTAQLTFSMIENKRESLKWLYCGQTSTDIRRRWDFVAGSRSDSQIELELTERMERPEAEATSAARTSVKLKFSVKNGQMLLTAIEFSDKNQSFYISLLSRRMPSVTLERRREEVLNLKPITTEKAKGSK